MYKLELELTMEEMMALGYCNMAGLQASAERRDWMDPHIRSLMEKVMKANEGNPPSTTTALRQGRVVQL